MVQPLIYEIKSHKKAAIISNRDRGMLEFLWRYRAATFQTLYRLFYSDAKKRTCYNRLDKLRHHGFIQTKGIDGDQKRYWCLDRRGMSYLTQVNGDIYKTLGFTPQSLSHDHLASVILLGDWFRQVPRGVSLITEQEMLSIELPKGSPNFQNEKVRRPDGLWCFEIGSEKKFVALELELHAKNDIDYVEIIKSYDNHYGIHKIIWVVEGPTLIKKIFQLCHQHSTLKPNDHLFLMASDVKRDLWQAKFKNDQLKETSLFGFLSSFLTHSKRPPMSSLESSLGSCPSIDMECSPKNVLLNFTTCFVKSDTYSKTRGKQKT